MMGKKTNVVQIRTKEMEMSNESMILAERKKSQ